MYIYIYILQIYTNTFTEKSWITYTTVTVCIINWSLLSLDAICRTFPASVTSESSAPTARVSPVQGAPIAYLPMAVKNRSLPPKKQNIGKHGTIGKPQLKVVDKSTLKSLCGIWRMVLLKSRQIYVSLWAQRKETCNKQRILDMWSQDH